MAQILVLMAAPGSGALSSDLMAGLAQGGLGPPRWLHPNEACEFSDFVALPEVAHLLRALAIDQAIVEPDNRRKRVLLADMDSTMIQQECIDELGVVAGVGDQIKAVTARAMNGELDFETALKARVALLKGLPVTVLAEVLARRITYMPGGRTLVRTMKASGAYCALVSGGFTAFSEPVAAHLGFDEHRANTLVMSGGRLTGEVKPPILGKEAKVESLIAISKRLGCSAADVIAVGDGANDIPMLLAAGLGVALHAKPAVQKAASHVINHGDLTSLLFLQGYSSDQFAAA